MTLQTILNAFAVAGPVLLAAGGLGHALVATKWGPAVRVGKLLEAVGTDWKRAGEAVRTVDVGKVAVPK